MRAGERLSRAVRAVRRRPRIVLPILMNLEYVLDSVADLLPDLAGKTGIASDHGNHLGDRSAPIPFREWGHPPTTYTRPLVKVPWFVVDADDRRPIESDPPVDESRAEDQQTVEERLNDLGYV